MVSINLNNTIALRQYELGLGIEQPKHPQKRYHIERSEISPATRMRVLK